MMIDDFSLWVQIHAMLQHFYFYLNSSNNMVNTLIKLKNSLSGLFPANLKQNFVKLKGGRNHSTEIEKWKTLSFFCVKL